MKYPSAYDKVQHTNKYAQHVKCKILNKRQLHLSDVK